MDVDDISFINTHIIKNTRSNLNASSRFEHQVDVGIGAMAARLVRSCRHL